MTDANRLPDPAVLSRLGWEGERNAGEMPTHTHPQDNEKRDEGLLHIYFAQLPCIQVTMKIHAGR